MKKWLVGFSAVIVLGFGAWIYLWWNQSATTTIVTTDTQDSRGVLGSQEKLYNWKTEFFTTRVPTSLRVITSNEVAHGLTTGQYLLGATSLSRDDQLAVTVGNLDAMRLDELPAVKLRSLQANAYRVATRSFMPTGGIAFSKIDTYETAIYWAHDTNYAAVVVSGSSAHKADLESALEAAVTNWQWR